MKEIEALTDIEFVDFIARPTKIAPPLDPRDDHDEYVALIVITRKDGIREEVYRSSNYMATIHAAVWDAARAWRTIYCNSKEM